MEKTREEKLKSLLVNAQKGDKKSYAQFLELLIPEVTKIVNAKTKHDREDIIQDILISVHNAKHTFDLSRPFAPWLYSICSFRISDQKRIYWKNLNKATNYADQLQSPAEDQTTLKRNEDIKDALNELPQRQREIVTLLKLEGYSIKEISEKLNLTVAAVKITAHRAYSTLRKILTEEI